MQHDMLVLVCHAVDRHFADGDRAAVRRILEESPRIARLDVLGVEKYLITAPDGGVLEVYAPGLNSRRYFQRMLLVPRGSVWSMDLLCLIYDLMCAGGFGLINNLSVPYFIVTQPQQIGYFPWLPEPPLLVRSAQDLACSIGQPVH